MVAGDIEALLEGVREVAELIIADGLNRMSKSSLQATEPWARVLDV